MSRFLSAASEAARRATRQPKVPRADWARGRRPFRVLTVTSNKGGVGKTTIAANLAVYVRALREDLPVLILEMDDHALVERMFAIRPGAGRRTLLDALRRGDLRGAIELGQYGVHYVPPSRHMSELKHEVWDPSFLLSVLERSQFEGLVIVDTKADFEILTRCAIAASDLVAVVVQDLTSLQEAGRVFEQLEAWRRDRRRARVLLSLVDLRIKYLAGESLDVLSVLLSKVRERGYPLFESFVSRSPKVESLYTNPEGRALSILHGAPGSLIHTQMGHLASEVLATLDSLPRPGELGIEAAPPRVRAATSEEWFPRA